MHHILIVDDEEPIVYMFKRFFEFSGFQVSATQYPHDALKIAENASIHGVITDFRMPGMNGDELLKKIRQHRPDLPAIIVSAYTGKSIHDMHPRTMVMSKPVEMQELLNTMQRLLNAKV